MEAIETSDKIIHQELTAENAAEPKENDCNENVEENNEMDDEDKDK